MIGLKCQHVGAVHTHAVANDAAFEPPCLCREAAVRVDRRDAGDVVRPKVAQRDVARIEGEREHDGLGARQPDVVVAFFEEAERRVIEAGEVSGLMDRDRLEIEETGLSVLGRRPRFEAVEEDVGLDNLAGHGVERGEREAEETLELGLGEEADRIDSVEVERLGTGQAVELEADRCGSHVLPAGEGTRHHSSAAAQW